jgi:hypothetical protein
MTMRPRKIVSVALTLWALLAMPTLCEAGVLTHNCVCDASVRCEHSTDCGHSFGGCRHEGGCSDDPCSRLTVRVERSTENSLLSFRAADAPISHAASEITLLLAVSLRAHILAATGAEVVHPTINLPLLI